MYDFMCVFSVLSVAFDGRRYSLRAAVTCLCSEQGNLTIAADMI